jgi:hypothetical protein
VACLFSLTYHIKPSFDSTVIRSKAIHSATPTPSIPPFALFASCLTANKDLYQASLRKSRLAGEFLCSLPRRPRRYRPLAGDNLQTILSLSWSLILALECNFRTYIGYIFTFNPPGQFIRIRQVSAAGRTDARLYIYTLNSDQVEEGRLQANFLACVPAFVDISLIKKYLAEKRSTYENSSAEFSQDDGAVAAETFVVGDSFYAKSQRFAGKLGVEQRGIERVPENERTDSTMSSVGTLV